MKLSISKGKVQEGVGGGRRPELVEGGLIRSLGGWRAAKTFWRKGRFGWRGMNGYAKAYQVKQIIKAIERLEAEHGAAK